MNKDEYEKIKNKFNLPNFDDLNRLFEISTVEYKDEFPSLVLISIRKKMIEKSEEFSGLLNSLLMPDTTILEMQESKIFHEKNQELISLYQKLIYYNRIALKLNLEINQENEINFIIEFNDFWKGSLPKLREILDKLVDLWKNNKNTKEVVGYFG